MARKSTNKNVLKSLIKTILTFTEGRYQQIKSALTLGETSDTAYRGDRGKTAYDHAITKDTNPHGTTATDVNAYDKSTSDNRFAPKEHKHTKSEITDMPTTMKNPNALTFTGSVTGSYDGSTAKTVNIPTVPSSLPANGGNADTVDNKHASDFAAVSTKNATNFNNMTTPGIYTMTNATTALNAPAAGNFSLIVMKSTNSKIQQLAIKENSNTAYLTNMSEIYTRQRTYSTGSTWSDWSILRFMNVIKTYSEYYNYNGCNILEFVANITDCSNKSDLLDNGLADDKDYIATRSVECSLPQLSVVGRIGTAPALLIRNGNGYSNTTWYNVALEDNTECWNTIFDGEISYNKKFPISDPYKYGIFSYDPIGISGHPTLIVGVIIKIRGYKCSNYNEFFEQTFILTKEIESTNCAYTCNYNLYHNSPIPIDNSCSSVYLSVYNSNFNCHTDCYWSAISDFQSLCGNLCSLGKQMITLKSGIGVNIADDTSIELYINGGDVITKISILKI